MNKDEKNGGYNAAITRRMGHNCTIRHLGNSLISVTEAMRTLLVRWNGSVWSTLKDLGDLKGNVQH